MSMVMQFSVGMVNQLVVHTGWIVGHKLLHDVTRRRRKIIALHVLQELIIRPKQMSRCEGIRSTQTHVTFVFDRLNKVPSSSQSPAKVE